MDIGDVENFWDFGVFAKNNDISVGREHFYLDSQIAWYRGDYTTDNYCDKDVYKSELNRYLQENVYENI